MTRRVKKKNFKERNCMNEIVDPEGYVPATDHPKWNQSLVCHCYDPDTKVGCFIRVGIQENLNESNTWFVFFKDGKPLFTRANMNLPYTPERMNPGMKIAGMEITVLEKLNKVRVQFDEADFACDLVWEGIFNPPMKDCVEMSQDEDGSFAREMMNVHLEGPYRITGSITIRNKETIDINGTGYRDVSYGPRNWDAMQHYRLAWPYFPERNITFAIVHGVSTDNHSAYLKMMHDGEDWIGIKSVDAKNTYGEDDMAIKTMDWTIVDEKDRTWQFTAKYIFNWLFPLDTFVLTEQFMEYTLSDGSVGYGLAESGYRLPWEGNGG